MSIAFHKRLMTLKQPDGTELQVLGSGNQYAATFETLDGHTVVEDPATGFYEYAVTDAEGDELVATGITAGAVPSSAFKLAAGARASVSRRKVQVQESKLPPGGTRWEKRLAARRATPPGALAAPPKRTTVGDYVGLVLLIDFPDVSGTIPGEEVERYCNEQGYRGFGNNGSVYDYFHDVSNDKLRYTNVVAPYYTAQHKRDYYTNEAIEQPKRTRELIQEALRYHKTKGTIDFTKLTLDTAQCAYALNVFYAGPCVNNWAKGLWPHSFHLGTSFPLASNAYAHDYQITNIGSELSLGTFCHENGHMICDFPDLYDYGYESRGVGKWCLMCAGNFDEKNPTHVGAYLKYRAGWATVKPVATGTVQAKAPGNEFFIHNRTPHEYLLLENRTRTGRDASLPGQGLAIWHIDEQGDNSNEQGTAALHYECKLIQADGRDDLENGSNDGDASDLFGNGVAALVGGRWWDGTSTKLELSGIGVPGASIALSTKLL